MQELCLVAVAEDGSYVVLRAPGRSGRFTLPVDDRLRVVARGQFSRLAQYEIEVERPLRPKEIQDRIRAGETAEEIADAAGVPIERVRRFEGPVLAERAYRAQEAQRASVRPPGSSGPGRGLGDIVSEHLRELGVDPAEADWDSRKNSDGTWQVKLAFSPGSRPQLAEWVFDPRRKHVSPADDTAARLSEPDAELPSPEPVPGTGATATVTPIGSRLATAAALAEPETGRQPEARRQPEAPTPPAHVPAFEPEEAAPPPPPQSPPRERPARKAAGGRSRRSSVPSWDEIMFGTSRRSD
jgi:Protein of unknown function (DUF3071)